MSAGRSTGSSQKLLFCWVGPRQREQLTQCAQTSRNHLLFTCTHTLSTSLPRKTCTECAPVFNIMAALQNKLSNERQRNCSPFLLHSLMIRIFSISTQRRGRCISYVPPNILRTSSLVLVKHHWSSAASAPFLLSQQLHWSSNWFSWPTKKRKKNWGKTDREREKRERERGKPLFHSPLLFSPPSPTHKHTHTPKHHAHLPSVLSGGAEKEEEDGGWGWWWLTHCPVLCNRSRQA